MLFHFFSGSYNALNYITDLVIIFSAFYSGYRWYDKQQKNKQAKEDAEEKERIEIIVKASVEASVERILNSVDSIIEKSIKDEIEDVNERINVQGKILENVEHEVTFNDGSSMKDSQRRVEQTLAKAAESLKALSDGQVAQAEMIHTQFKAIERIEGRQDKMVTTLAAHIGAHAGLPEYE